jgi:ASCH domain-containing protein
MNLYRRYFDLVADGSKTVEVRVEYPSLRSLKAGDYIRFICGPEKEALGVLAIEIELVTKPTSRDLPRLADLTRSDSGSVPSLNPSPLPECQACVSSSASCAPATPPRRRNPRRADLPRSALRGEAISM